MADGEDLHGTDASPSFGGASTALLRRGIDPEPVAVARPDGRAPFLLVADHAGRAIPAALGDLGLPEAERGRHIGWDIGVAGVAERLGAMLDATTVTQRYSRLVIDCNRRVGAPGSVVEVSDGTRVPGNAGLGAADVAARAAAIHAPYQAAVAAHLGGRVLVALHSFTPVMAGVARPWHAGVLHMGDSAFARAVLDLLRAEGDIAVGDNEPYAMDGTDWTVPAHQRGGRYVELEIRQDLIADEVGQAAWAARLARVLPAALAAAV